MEEGKEEDGLTVQSRNNITILLFHVSIMQKFVGNSCI